MMCSLSNSEVKKVFGENFTSPSNYNSAAAASQKLSQKRKHFDGEQFITAKSQERSDSNSKERKFTGLNQKRSRLQDKSFNNAPQRNDQLQQASRKSLKDSFNNHNNQQRLQYNNQIVQLPPQQIQQKQQNWVIGEVNEEAPCFLSNNSDLSEPAAILVEYKQPHKLSEREALRQVSVQQLQLNQQQQLQMQQQMQGQAYTVLPKMLYQQKLPRGCYIVKQYDESNKENERQDFTIDQRHSDQINSLNYKESLNEVDEYDKEEDERNLNYVLPLQNAYSIQTDQQLIEQSINSEILNRDFLLNNQSVQSSDNNQPPQSSKTEQNDHLDPRSRHTVFNGGRHQQEAIQQNGNNQSRINRFPR